MALWGEAWCPTTSQQHHGKCIEGLGCGQLQWRGGAGSRVQARQQEAGREKAQLSRLL